MKYHEDYDLEMTPSEAKYHEMLKYRDQVVEIANNLKSELLASQNQLIFSTEELHNLIHCEIVEDNLLFSIKHPNAEFFYSPDTSSKDYFDDFYSCYNNLGFDCSERDCPAVISLLVSLKEAYYNYLDAYAAI